MKKRIIQVIYSAIDEINESKAIDELVEKSTDTVLFGATGKLDSLGLVNLIVTTEEKIEDEFDTSITLADERAMSESNSPFKTVESLVNYIEVLLLEERNE